MNVHEKADNILAAVERVVQATKLNDVDCLGLLGEAEKELGSPFNQEDYDDEQNERIIEHAIRLGSTHLN
jgi:hypothetical protein